MIRVTYCGSEAVDACLSQPRSHTWRSASGQSRPSIQSLPCKPCNTMAKRQAACIMPRHTLPRMIYNHKPGCVMSCSTPLQIGFSLSSKLHAKCRMPCPLLLVCRMDSCAGLFASHVTTSHCDLIRKTFREARMNVYADCDTVLRLPYYSAAISSISLITRRRVRHGRVVRAQPTWRMPASVMHLRAALGQLPSPASTSDTVAYRTGDVLATRQWLNQTLPDQL